MFKYIVALPSLQYLSFVTSTNYFSSISVPPAVTHHDHPPAASTPALWFRNVASSVLLKYATLLHISVVHGSVAVLVNHSSSGINRITAPIIGASVNSLLGLIDIIYSFGNRSRLKRVPVPGTSSLIDKGQDGRQPYNAIQSRNPLSGFICHVWHDLVVATSCATEGAADVYLTG